MAKPKDDEWLSVVEVAKRLGLSRTAVYQAIAEGRLKARERVIMRRVVRIDPASLAAFQVSKSHQRRARKRWQKSPTVRR
jgi:excisionase family DNA binding protein